MLILTTFPALKLIVERIENINDSFNPTETSQFEFSGEISDRNFNFQILFPFDFGLITLFPIMHSKHFFCLQKRVVR